MAKGKILVVDDEEHILELLKFNIKNSLEIWFKSIHSGII